MTAAMDAKTLRETAGDIVSAYVQRNVVPWSKVPELIATVHHQLQTLTTNPSFVASPVPLVPAVSIRESVQPDAIQCFECGKYFQAMRGHLRAKHGLTPEKYRSKWSLPPDYPTVAPNYSLERSRISKKLGLGGYKGAASVPASRPGGGVSRLGGGQD